MKRLFAFTVTVITLFIFAGCSSPAKKEITRENLLDTAFSSEADITLGKLNAQAVITRSGKGEWETEVSSPDSLSGIKLTFTEGNVKASYKGLEMSVPQSALPVKAMMLCLIEAVDTNASAETLTGSENGKYLDISGNINGGEYILSVDDKGAVHSFVMDNNQLNIKFNS